MFSLQEEKWKKLKWKHYKAKINDPYIEKWNTVRSATVVEEEMVYSISHEIWFHALQNAVYKLYLSIIPLESPSFMIDSFKFLFISLSLLNPALLSLLFFATLLYCSVKQCGYFKHVQYIQHDLIHRLLSSSLDTSISSHHNTILILSFL